MLCTIPGGDIVLGHDGHQIGITGDLIDLLGLALGDKNRALFRFCVHGFFQTVFQIDPEQ
jgi:hypothetical protein